MKNIRLEVPPIRQKSIETCIATLTVETEDGRTIRKELDFSGNAIGPTRYGARLVVQALAEAQAEEGANGQA